MQLNGSNNSLISEINVTPFVDVMLVLLIIFMVTAPMMVQGVNVNLPKASSDFISPDNDNLIISIDSDLKIYINDQEVGIPFLTKQLGNVLANVKSQVVYLKADQKVPYGFVVTVMSEIKKAGVESLGMITLPEDQEKS